MTKKVSAAVFGAIVAFGILLSVTIGLTLGYRGSASDLQQQLNQCKAQRPPAPQTAGQWVKAVSRAPGRKIARRQQLSATVKADCLYAISEMSGLMVGVCTFPGTAS